MSAILLGATGLVGKHLLPSLLASSEFNRVGECGRRMTTPAPTTPETKTFSQHTVDFENLSASSFGESPWDVVYITLGTTKAIAGSKAAFTKIDKDYVVNAARELRKPGHKQRLVYLSTVSASSSSFIFYLKSKGETEEALAELGYDDYIVLRPGMFLNPDRSGTKREGETLPAIQRMIGEWFAPTIEIPDIAVAMRVAGEKGSDALSGTTKSTGAQKFTIMENDAIKALAASSR